MANKLIQAHGWDLNYCLKPVRKALKIGILATMNGGRPGNEQHFLKVLKGHHDQDNVSLTKLAPQISKCIVESTLTKEITDLCTKLIRLGSVFNVQSYKLVRPDNSKGKHSLLSNLWAAGESMLLTYVVQALYYWKVKAIVLSLEHDGLCLGVLEPHSERDLSELRDLIDNLALHYTGVKVAINITRLIED